ncbi:fiber-2 [Human mastadenovirus F]|uniref:Fiber protein 1 n=14 Tax=Human adenovirus F serotype 40 TaxID=28284 RepID=SPIK1_ADE40|nr:fiber-2 [Human mastadenovirus F]P18047.1 RecName: Full=Fiber protein 1; Short=SPIKE [Human adenovirus 40]AAA03234.1 59kda fiber polypeptide [Human adenovirus 40]AAC13980.1 fiber-2 [Human mastadenovirus F]
MKRARFEDDFNPVYPYEHYNPLDIPFITPPFASSNGLQEKPPGVLSLKYTDPLTTKNGALTLKLGTGLNIDKNGDLSSDASVEVSAPITKTNKIVGLNYTKPLALQNNALTLSYNAPFNVVNNNLALNMSQPVTINANNELSLLIDAPLNADTGTLRLRSDAPLGLVDKTLKVLFSSPLYLDNNFLTLAIERPLALSSNRAVALKYSPPLKIENENLTLSTGGPFTVSGGNLNLATSAPLSVQNNSLSLGVNPPFLITDSGLAMDLGDGLALGGSKLIINLGPGLQMSNGAITLALDAALPLQYKNNQLQLRIGSASALIMSGVTQTLNVNANTSKGLAIENNSLVVKLGNGLRFDSWGSIAVSPTTTTPTTLWTTADPSPNATFYESLDAKVWLVLVKCNGMVNGTISIKAQKGTLLKPTASFISFVMYFYSDGTWRKNYPVFDNEGILANSATWGYRQGQSANTNVSNAVEFMPSSKRYPNEKGSEVQNMALTYTFLQGDPNMAISFQSIYNHAIEGYSLKFTWRVRNNERFDIPCCSFSYVTEQ